MPSSFRPFTLLGLPLAEATRLLAESGIPARVVKTVPGRSRQFPELPPEAAWRVVRALITPEGLELVVAPALPLPVDEDR